MTVLVTGASGGFGSVFLPLLRARYHEPVIGTGRSNKFFDNYIKCDFSDGVAIRSLIKSIRPNFIFHLAGSFTGEFECDLKINALSARYIFESIISENLKTRVVIFGSAAEYGAVLPSDNPIPESFLGQPVSEYGQTKAFQTDLARYYARTKNVDVVVARVFNLATPGLSPRLFHGRAESMILSYKRGEIQRLEFGNLEAERDYIALDKAVAQILAIAEHGITGEIYNVGSGFPQKIRSILMGMLIKEGVPDVDVVESKLEVIKEKGFDVPVIYADMAKTLRLMDLSVNLQHSFK